MSFQESLEQIRDTIRQHGDKLANEEMTKQALILPMIEAWGYDTRNPSEVMAEYPVTLANGGNGRADYVIMQNERPAIVIECKAANVTVDESVSDQMRDYAAALGAVVGVATNGYTYTCYTDLDSAGTMDADPFCVAIVQSLPEGDEVALELLAKVNFAPDQVRVSARLHKEELVSRWRAEAFTRSVPAQDELTRIAEFADKSERDTELTQLLKKIGERIHVEVDAIRQLGRSDDADDGVVTTNDELDGYFIVKGILHGVIDPDRVEYRDAKTYFSVLIDDNNRKPICRFHFNGRQKYVGTFDEDKNETRHSVNDVNDIIEQANTLRRMARRYAKG